MKIFTNKNCPFPLKSYGGLLNFCNKKMHHKNNEDNHWGKIFLSAVFKAKVCTVNFQMCYCRKVHKFT